MMRELLFAAALANLLLTWPAHTLAADAIAADKSAGSRIFKAANCVACHKWTGQGGGGYGGAAANLRQTKLDKDQIVETVRCGHPGGGGMPYFQEDAYRNGSCYGGVKASDLDAKTMPAAAEHFLARGEIDAVADYVISHFKGKGEPTFEECRGFFGAATHLCDTYPKAGDTADASGHDGDDPPPRRGLKIEAAPDANTKGAGQ